MVNKYLKIAWRSIRKNKTTSIINIIGLSAGMAAAVLILIWVQNERSYDKYHPDNERIYRLTTRLPKIGWIWETTPLLLADAIKTGVPEVEKVTRLYTNNWPVFNVKGNLFYEKDGAYVDNDWFTIFHFDFLEGNAVSFNEHPYSIILTSSEAKKYFGDGKALGQSIHIDSLNYQVTAVIADPPVNSSFRFHAYLPMAALLANPDIRKNDEDWGNDNYITFIKSIPGGNPVTIARKLTDIIKKNKKNDDGSSQVSLISLPDMHFENEIKNSEFKHGNLNTVYIFGFLAFLLLLVACINYVNLTTAKASLRAREVSIRKIVGASRINLFFQFFAESILISLISLVLTLLLIHLCLPAFNAITEKKFSLPLNSIGLWLVLGITLFTAFLLNSIYPAILLSSFKPLNVFRGVTILKMKDSSFRKGLVVLQFCISFMLIAGTLIIYSQLQFIQKKDPGYSRSQLISFELPSSIGNKMESVSAALKQDLLSQSNIESVTTSNQPIVNMRSKCNGCIDWQGRDTTYNPIILQLNADADFQKTMQLKMKEGRWYKEGFVEDKHGFILNETAVQNFKLKAPVVGMPFIFRGDTGKVIGVVKDFVCGSMHETIGPVVIFNDPRWRNHFAVRASAGNQSAIIAGIIKLWKKNVPDTPLEYSFMDETFNKLYKSDQQASLLILVFAVIAVFISALGLFSLAAFAAEQRTKEIGIRKVLGATVKSIAFLISKGFIQLVFVSIIIATPIGWWAMNKWLQNFAYHIQSGWVLFLLAGIIALIIALLTVSFQAIRAAVANPVKSLRTE